MHLKYNLEDARTVPSVSAYADQPLEPGAVIEVPDDFEHDGEVLVETDEPVTVRKTEPEAVEPEPVTEAPAEVEVDPADPAKVDAEDKPDDPGTEKE